MLRYGFLFYGSLLLNSIALCATNNAYNHSLISLRAEEKKLLSELSHCLSYQQINPILQKCFSILAQKENTISYHNLVYIVENLPTITQCYEKMYGAQKAHNMIKSFEIFMTKNANDDNDNNLTMQAENINKAFIDNKGHAPTRPIVNRPIKKPVKRFKRPVQIIGPTTLNSTLDVGGDTNIKGNFSINTNKFTVSGTTGDTFVAGKLTVAGQFVLPKDLAFVGDTEIGGDLNVKGAATIAKDTSIGGTLTVNSASTLSKTLNVGGNSTLTGNTSVGGTFSVDGATALNKTANLSENLNVAGNASISGNLSVGGTFNLPTNTTLPGNTTINVLNVSGASTLAGDTSVGGALTIAGAAILNKTLNVTGASILAGNTSIGGTLGVTGATTLLNTSIGGTLGVTGASNLTGDTSIGGALTVGGATILNKTLGVTGASTLSGNTSVGGTLGVTGATTLANTAVGGTLGVTGASTLANTSVGGTLGVTGASTLSGNASVGGTLGVTGASTLNGNASVGGSLTVTGATTLNALNILGTTSYSDIQLAGPLKLGNSHIIGQKTIPSIGTSATPILTINFATPAGVTGPLHKGALIKLSVHIAGSILGIPSTSYYDVSMYAFPAVTSGGSVSSPIILNEASTLGIGTLALITSSLSGIGTTVAISLQSLLALTNQSVVIFYEVLSDNLTSVS